MPALDNQDEDLRTENLVSMSPEALCKHLVPGSIHYVPYLAYCAMFVLSHMYIHILFDGISHVVCYTLCSACYTAYILCYLVLILYYVILHSLAQPA